MQIVTLPRIFYLQFCLCIRVEEEHNLFKIFYTINLYPKFILALIMLGLRNEK